MSGFSVDWLDLRAAADGRARALDLLAELAPHRTSPAEVVDLGAGSGATLRALAPHLPGARWCLVDADADLLAEAERRAKAAGITVTTRCADLTRNPAPWTGRPALVTASALFDLASPAFIAAFAQAAAAAAVPVLAMLTFDGRLSLTPPHPLDAAMVDAFNTHQRGEKSFGRAAGPDAPQHLAEAFAAHGYRVIARDTPWRLEAGRDDALIAATIDGWAGAAREVASEPAAAIAAWRAARLAATDTLLVGHRDQLFLPPR
ncbi:MAG: hypothetical protein AcusKO_13990 [Acuticoccus sp.]